MTEVDDSSGTTHVITTRRRIRPVHVIGWWMTELLVPYQEEMGSSRVTVSLQAFGTGLDVVPVKALPPFLGVKSCLPAPITLRDP